MTVAARNAAQALRNGVPSTGTDAQPTKGDAASWE